MPAGVYTIALVSPAGVLEISNTATHAAVMVIGSPISTAPGDQIAKVTFAPVNGKYALAQVYLPSGAGFGVPTRTSAR